MSRRRLIEDAIGDSNIFKDETTLLPEFVPDELIARENEIRSFIKNFRPLLKLDSAHSVNVAVIGEAGVGKTALVKYAMQGFSEVAQERGVNIDFLYYNCHAFRSKTAILRHILTNNFGVQSRGFSDEEIMEMIMNRLKRENKRLVIAIDEANMLKSEEILSIIRANEFYGYEHARISTVIISRTAEWRAILNVTLSQYIIDQIVLRGYNKDQLLEILKYRAELAFYKSAIDDGLIELVAEIAAKTQNARHGIEILHSAGRIADERHAQHLTPEHIRQANNLVYQELRPDVFYDLRIHELFSALAIARILARPNVIDTTINEAYEEYQVVVEEYSESKHSLPSFRLHLTTLQKVGLITYIVGSIDGGKGRRGKITLHEIPAQLMVERVRKIIDDRLNKK